jgi:hypothetical protein
MSEAGKRLTAAVRALRRTRTKDGREKTADDLLADQQEYDAAMRGAKEYSAANPSVTEWGEQGWTDMTPEDWNQ